MEACGSYQGEDGSEASRERAAINAKQVRESTGTELNPHSRAARAERVKRVYSLRLKKYNILPASMKCMFSTLETVILSEHVSDANPAVLSCNWL